MYRRDRSGRGYDRDRRDDRRDDRLVAPPREVRDDRAAERAGLHWVRVDMHLHTPASSDYRDPEGTYLKILQRAEERGLDIIALTDHNSVQGYAQMLEEIRTLEMLETRGRLNDDEIRDLAEYRRLRETLLVLPGFEFTATFGFHILGLFPPGTSLRKLELLLLKLDVPEHKMLAGAPDAGPTSDVIEAYEAIHEAGGLAIAAHANSSNGVAMQGFNFGGQTKIAYTQHTALAALEVTDLDQSGRRTTESFFNGSKPEYPRRMHCIQGSDAHSIDKEPGEGANKRLGVGDRCTELLLPTPTFEAMRALFAGNDFDRIRPYRPGQVATYDFVRQARSQGPSIVQAFHERASTKTTRTRGVLKDVAAFANTSGGTIYLGVSADEAVPVRGVDSVEDTQQMLRLDIQRSIVPPLDVTFTTQVSDGHQVVLLQVPRGDARPYMFETAGQIYVRQESESVPATRDDIVRLVLEAHGERMTAELAAAALSVPEEESAAAAQALSEAEMLSDEMVEDAISGSSVPLDLAHRRKRRRRRGGVGAAGESGAESETTEDDEPAAVAAWTTTPAWEGPEDAGATPPDRAAAVATAQADFGLTADPAVEPMPDAEAAAAGRGRRGRGRGQRSETEVAEAAATLAATRWQPQGAVLAEPVAAEIAEPPVAATTPAPPLATAPEPAGEAPRVRRKGTLYQVHRNDLGEPEVGNATRERRAGLYSDRAGELLDAALRAANPAGMFELERNQLWLPDGVAPVLPEGLTARRRVAGLLNDTVLNAKSGPGGVFRSAAELAPPAPTPNPSPTKRGENAVSPAVQEPQAEATTVAEAAPPARTGRGGRGRSKAATAVAEAATLVSTEPAAVPTPTAVAAPTAVAPTPAAVPTATEITPGIRTLPGEKLSGKRVRAGAAPAPVTPTAPVPATPVAPAAPTRTTRGGKAAAAPPERTPEPGNGAAAPPPPTKPGPATVPPPRTGVEVVATENRNGVPYHSMRDLRNGSIVHNVTRYSARRLWYYAIMRHEAGAPDPAEITWSGEVGLWHRVKRANVLRYDLVSREPDGSLRMYYGVTEDGINGPWRDIDLDAADIEQSEGEGDWG